MKRLAARFAILGSVCLCALLITSGGFAFTDYYGPANASPSTNHSTSGFNNRASNEGYNNQHGIGPLVQIWEKHTDGTTVGSAVAAGDVSSFHAISYTQAFCGDADSFYLLLRCTWGS